MPRDASRYVIDGRRWPSVTEILQLAGLSDFGMVPRPILERARQRGEDFHEWRAAIDDGVIDDDVTPPQAIASRIAAYRRFRAETGFVVEESERVVTHRALRYVGTFDLVGRMPDGRRFVVDTKAVAAVQPATRLQIAGYAMALDEEPERTERIARAALQLLPDGSYRWLPRTKPAEEREDSADWIAACRIAHFRLAHGLAKLDSA